MSEIKKTPLNRSQQKRLDIITAAENVFIEFGYKGASMDRIAEQANVSKRTVYNHFETKEALFQHIIESLTSELLDVRSLPYQKSRSLEEQLKEILSAEWDLLVSKRFIDMARVVLSEYLSTPELSQGAMDNMSRCDEGLSPWLLAAKQDKQLKDIDVEFASNYLAGTIYTFAQNQTLYRDLPPPSKKEKDYILAEVIGMFLARYGA